MVWGCDFHGSRQIKHYAVITWPCFAPCLKHSLAQLHSKVGLSLAESLHTVVELEMGASLGGALLRQLADELDGIGDEFEGLLA
jgi:hypothetical protein